MMMNAQKKDPQLVAQIQDMIESGMEPQKIADTLMEQEERKQHGFPCSKDEEQEYFSDEIIIASQALAYRDAREEDIPTIVRIINAAYAVEVTGKEAFRLGPNTVSEDIVKALLVSEAYRWILLEVPCGMNIERDGTVLGACCFTTNGVSRKNGEVEGKLGSIRYFAVVPRYHGVLIGHRFLKKIENVMVKAGCCRIMICIPDTRLRLIDWLLDRDYLDINTVPYPQEVEDHKLLATKKNTMLVMFAKPLSPEHQVPKLGDIIAKDNNEVVNGDGDVRTPPSAPSSKLCHLPPHWRDIISSSQDCTRSGN